MNRQLLHQERQDSCNIKDWADQCTKKGQSVSNTSRRKASSVLEGVICRRQQKGVGLSVTVQDRVTSFDTQHHDTKRVDGVCRAISCRLSTDHISVVHASQERTTRRSPLIATADWTVLPPAWVMRTAHSRSSRHPKRTTGATTSKHITTQLLRNLLYD